MTGMLERAMEHFNLSGSLIDLFTSTHYAVTLCVNMDDDPPTN